MASGLLWCSQRTVRSSELKVDHVVQWLCLPLLLSSQRSWHHQFSPRCAQFSDAFKRVFAVVSFDHRRAWPTRQQTLAASAIKPFWVKELSFILSLPLRAQLMVPRLPDAICPHPSFSLASCFILFLALRALITPWLQTGSSLTHSLSPQPELKLHVGRGVSVCGWTEDSVWDTVGTPVAWMCPYTPSQGHRAVSSPSWSPFPCLASPVHWSVGIGKDVQSPVSYTACFCSLSLGVPDSLFFFFPGGLQDLIPPPPPHPRPWTWAPNSENAES